MVRRVMNKGSGKRPKASQSPYPIKGTQDQIQRQANSKLVGKFKQRRKELEARAPDGQGRTLIVEDKERMGRPDWQV